MTRLLFLAMLLVACKEKGGDSAEPEDADDTGGSTQDGGSEDVEIVYPSGDRVLLYNGHGGFPGDGTGKGHFDDVDTRWKDAYGWNTDVRDAWPEDMSPYRLIGLVAPGAADSEPFTAEDVALLTTALEAGTRVAVLADAASCASTDVADLLGALGVAIRFTGEGADQNYVVASDGVNTQHQVTAGVSDVQFKAACWVNPSGGSALINDRNSNSMGAAQRPGSGGDVVLLGDFQFLDDGGYIDDVDNALLADNLAIVDPAGPGAR